MDHNDALQLMAAEKYLLNELSADEREQFEEHFFECPDCANDLRLGTIFLQQSKAVLASESSSAGAATTAEPAKHGWFAWLRPIYAAPAIAILLAVIVYQNWAARPAPHVLPAAFITIGSRGENVPSLSTRPGESLLLRLTVPPGPQYSSYAAEIYGPDGKLEWSLKLPYSADNDAYFIQVPGQSVEGRYAIAVDGVGADGNRSQIGRSVFEVHVVR